MWGILRSLFARKPPLPEDVRAPPPEFARADAPDWLLAWGGWMLPHGGGYEGRLPLRERDAQPTAEVAYPVRRGRPPHTRAVELSGPAAERLWAVLRGAFPEGLLSVSAQCCDGLPFEGADYRREPYRGVRARCNLGDGLDLLRPGPGTAGRPPSELVESEARAGRPIPPVFRLGFLLLELSVAGVEQAE
jgi:hypothetical protein